MEEKTLIELYMVFDEEEQKHYEKLFKEFHQKKLQESVKYAKDNNMSNSTFDFIRNNDYIKLAKKCASQKKHEKFKIERKAKYGYQIDKN